MTDRHTYRDIRNAVRVNTLEYNINPTGGMENNSNIYLLKKNKGK